MLDCIQGLLAKGVSPVSVNTYLRALKAYVRWLHQEDHLKEVFKVQFLKTESKVLATFSPDQIKTLGKFLRNRKGLTRPGPMWLLSSSWILDSASANYRASSTSTAILTTSCFV